MEIIEFLKYYFSEVIKKWVIIFIFLVPSLVPTIVDTIYFYFGSQYSEDSKNILIWIRSWWVWIFISAFFILNVKIIYRLWKEKKEEVENQGSLQHINIPESYKAIVRKLEQFAPERSEKIRKNFAYGHKCLTELANPDIKTAISIHFSAYKSIQDFLTKYFNDTRSSANVQITVEISEIKAKFEENFSQLWEHNDTIGKNENFQIDKHEANKLIENINDNLIALFAHF